MLDGGRKDLLRSCGNCTCDPEHSPHRGVRPDWSILHSICRFSEELLQSGEGNTASAAQDSRCLRPPPNHLHMKASGVDARLHRYKASPECHNAAAPGKTLTELSLPTARLRIRRFSAAETRLQRPISHTAPFCPLTKPLSAPILVSLGVPVSEYSSRCPCKCTLR